MDRALLKGFICLILIFLCLYLYKQINLRHLNSKPIIVADTRFYGKQLALNYYEFSVIDYHRFLIQKKPFVVFIYSDDCKSCLEQDFILKNNSLYFAVYFIPILRVNFKDSHTDINEIEFAKIYRVTKTHTFIAIDRDSNPVLYKFGLQNLTNLKQLMEKI